MTARMQAGALKPQIDRLYKAAPAFQWLRESAVNGIQAKATCITFGIEWFAVESVGVYRRTIEDDGHAMPRDKMLAFLNKFGGTGKTLDAIAENFGIGFKVSAFPWNHYGIVVISRQDDEITMIWLHYDADLDDYGAREFALEEADGTTTTTALVPLDEYDDFYVDADGVDWVKVAPEKTGVKIVLLGSSPSENTILGDPSQNERGKYAITEYINNRFYEIPAGVTIREEQLSNYGDPAKWPKSRQEWIDSPDTQYRVARGVKSRLEDIFRKPTKAHPDRGVAAEGTVVVTPQADTMGAEIHWTLYNDPPKSGVELAAPHVMVRHSMHDGIEEIMYNSSKAALLNRFVKVTEVQKRLGIIIVPKPGADTVLYPDASRARLMWENPTSRAQEVPMDEWSEHWRNNMPKEIRDAINAYYKRQSEGMAGGLTDADYQALADKYFGMLHRVVRQVKASTGTIPGVPTEGTGGGGREKSKNPPKPKPDPEHGGENTRRSHRKPKPGETHTPTKESTVKGGLIKVVSDHLGADEWAVTFDENGADGQPTATINLDAQSYLRVQEWVVEKYEAKGLIKTQSDRDIVILGVQAASEKHVTLAVSEIYVESKAAGVDDRRAMLSDAAVSNALKGIAAIESLASGQIGSSLSGKKRTKKAA